MMRVPLTVARTEFRRTVRAITTDRTKLLLMALLGLLMFGSATVAGGYLLPALGTHFAESATAETVALATSGATGGVAVAWLAMVVMAGIRAFTAATDPDEPAFLLVSTSVRNVTLGVIAAELLLFAVWLLPPAVVLSSAFAVGAGTALPVLFAVAVVVLGLLTAVPIGFVLGIWVRHLVTVYEPIARYRWVIFVGFWGVYFGAIASGRFDLVVTELFVALQDSPLGWPGHLLLAGVPNVSASSSAIFGAVAGTALVGATALAVAIASARVHWFADPARFDDAPSSASDSSSRLGAAIGGLGRPVRTVTLTAIRRTRRAPIRLVYVAYPLFGAIGFVQGIVQTGTVPSYVAVLLSLYVVWAAGALFTLNPLGDLGRALPAVVTSTLTGRQAISGLVVAGALVVVPIALVVSLGLGLVSPLSLEHTAALAAGTVVGAVVTPALATGVGTAFPRFGSVNVTSSREAVVPSKIAFLVYSLAVILPTVAAAVLYTDAAEPIATTLVATAAWAPTPELAVTGTQISVVAWIVLGIGLLAPPVSYLYACETFDLYTLE
jgi:ABC-2 type transport system permease protein